MSSIRFDTFFEAATGNKPYGYQRRLACGQEQEQDLTAHALYQSQVINIPTGLGKTAAVVLAWLWNRLHEDQRCAWPRRLVYCLPMRTLVEQTRDNVRDWLTKLAKEFPTGPDFKWLAENSPIILMGGEDAVDWDIHPERPAIVIGTQDMLLSRALNRGYGMSRYRWPMHFGLLNTDSLWVLDETQLMGVGVETSAQLDGFRHLVEWANGAKCPTWWMSATLDEDRLATVDHPRPQSGWTRIELGSTERALAGIRERFEARKLVTKAALVLNADTKKTYAGQLANLIASKHQPDSLTLVVVNRVARAREVYAALKKAKSSSVSASRIALIHSRFRPMDRAGHTKLLFSDGDRIVIATQAVEAGVDVSARLLISELAPWSSLVQRLGRCNRRGDLNQTAEMLWIDIQPRDEKDDLLLPYSVGDLKKAREAISALPDAGPASLAKVQISETPLIRPVIRRRDLIDLFDTTPDLCGQDLDVSRYIRDGEDSDVQFYWRSVAENSKPTPEEAAPLREELCRVSIAEAQKFIDKESSRAWEWNSLEGVWKGLERVRPGGLYFLDASSGGYNDELGWTGEPRNRPTPYTPERANLESYSKDAQSFNRFWLSLEKHTQDVVATIGAVIEPLQLGTQMIAAFEGAALWHDVGKAHEAFQNALRFGPHKPEDPDTVYAKSKNPYNPRALDKQRQGFRHELASALAWLSAGPDAAERDLVAYLIAAHHGKVRLSIRSLPNEKGDPGNPASLYARGLWDKDSLPAVSGVLAKPVTLDLRLMQMGQGEQGASWLARMIALRDGLGPFRLAYLETLLRAADMRASREEFQQSTSSG